MFQRDNPSSESRASAMLTQFYSYSSGKYFAAGLLCLLIIQNTSAVLLARYTRTKYNYDVNNMLLIAECMKLVTSLVLESLTFVKVEDEETVLMAARKDDRRECLSLRRRGCALLESFRLHILDNPRDALKLTIPAGLYLLQNSLVYYSISLVPVPLFQITQQTKLVTTAILSVIFLKRSYSRTQWCCILALCVGAAICIFSVTSNKQSGESLDDNGLNTASTLFGLMLIVVSNMSSSVAGIYFEVVIKNKDERATEHPPSIWMRNIQLSFFTICIISAKLIASDEKTPFFYDFTPLLWLQISIFAFGGLLVASVIKFTDSVQKGLATGLSVITSSALAMLIESSRGISFNFILGSTFAIGGCFLFANPDIDLKHIPCTSKTKKRGVVKMLGTIIVFSISTVSFYYTRTMLKDATTIFEYTPTMSNVTTDWKDTVHVHVMVKTIRKRSNGCGGCMVLWELVDSVADLGITTSSSRHCPSDEELDGPITANKTISIVYPEVDGHTCEGSGNRVHVRWILAPLGSHTALDNFKKWGEDDLVFNYASSCAVHPNQLPASNILQVITNPKDGDEYDLPVEVFNKTDRQGTIWTLRKGPKWHKHINQIHEELPEPRVQHKAPTPNVFQRFEYFVSYDPYTFYSYAAAMSGAISIVHPLANLTKKEWAAGTYVGEYLKANGGDVPGIAYGWSKEEIKYAKETMPKLRQFMMNVRAWGKESTVERFTRDCYWYGVGLRENFTSALLVRDAYTS